MVVWVESSAGQSFGADELEPLMLDLWWSSYFGFTNSVFTIFPFEAKNRNGKKLRQ
jgi:hypothetical protein